MRSNFIVKKQKFISDSKIPLCTFCLLFFNLKRSLSFPDPTEWVPTQQNHLPEGNLGEGEGSSLKNSEGLTLALDGHVPVGFRGLAMGPGHLIWKRRTPLPATTPSPGGPVQGTVQFPQHTYPVFC